MLKGKCIKYSTFKKVVYFRSLKLYRHKDPWGNISRDCPYVRKCSTERTVKLNNLLKTLVVGVVCYRTAKDYVLASLYLVICWYLHGVKSFTS